MENDIDLIRLVKVLIKRKWLIIGGTILTTLAAIIISFMLPKAYKSEGFFKLSSGVDSELGMLKVLEDKLRQDFKESENKVDNKELLNYILLNETLKNRNLVFTMDNVSIPDYKKYLPQFANPRKLIKYMEYRHKKGGERIDGLADSLHTSADIRKWLSPVYAYTKNDLKDLTANSRDIKNFVLGVSVSGEQNSPENAREFVALLGHFIKSSVLFGKLNEYIDNEWNKGKTETLRCENLILKDEFTLQQLTAKQRHMEGVRKKYPQSKSTAGRQLYSLENSGHRYLSPAAQLVGIESHIADLKENLAKNRRQKQLAHLRSGFFAKARELITSETFGEVLLEKVGALQDSYFIQKDVPNDVLQQSRNQLAIDFGVFFNLKDEMQFISGPTLPRVPVKPQKTLIAAVAMIAAFFIFVFLAFGLEWWISNKKKIDNE